MRNTNQNPCSRSNRASLVDRLIFSGDVSDDELAAATTGFASYHELRESLLASHVVRATVDASSTLCREMGRRLERDGHVVQWVF